MKVCFVEAVLRDQRDGAIGDLPMDEAELHYRFYSEIEIAEPLTMVDPREGGDIVMGVPTDVVKASSHALARAWAVAFYERPEKPDGHRQLERTLGRRRAIFLRNEVRQ